MKNNFKSLIGEVKRIADAQDININDSYADKISIQSNNDTSVALDPCYQFSIYHGDFKILTTKDSLNGKINGVIKIPLLLSPKEYVRIYSNSMVAFSNINAKYAGDKDIIVSSPTLRYFTAIEYGVKSLSLSGCPALTDAYISNNKIESIDLTKNPKLKEFHIYINNLKSLDISQNIALERCDIGDNRELSSMTLPTGNLEKLKMFATYHTSLSLETIMQLADKLPNRTGQVAGTLGITKTVYDMMTQEQKKLITNKNFSLIGK